MSLGLLVGRFGSFVRETRASQEDSAPPPPFPDGLNHLRDAVGHHLIPLVLIARSDGDFEPRERDVIVTHCITFARNQGLELDGSGTIEFVQYVESYRPSLMQLDPALSRLERGDHDEMAVLVAAARAVIEADGVIRPEEARFLDQLSEEIGRLRAKS
jgi:hypothetical protein